MNKSSRHFVALTAVAALAGIGSTGCMTYSGPSAADFQKVENDPNLSQSDKEQKLDEMASSANYYAPNYWLIGGVLIVGLGLFGGGTMVRRRLEAGPSTATDKRGATKAAPKPTVKQPKRAAPAPTSAPMFAAKPAPVVEEAPKLPETQAEVDALLFDERGTSFFTARPAHQDSLVRVEIEAGIWIHRVVCTEDEARQIAEGDIPRIRAFTIGEKTAPWYEWLDFNPYEHYMDAMSGDWRSNGVRAIACWLTLNQCDPSLKGYYSGSSNANESAEADEDKIPAEVAS